MRCHTKVINGTTSSAPAKRPAATLESVPPSDAQPNEGVSAPVDLEALLPPASDGLPPLLTDLAPVSDVTSEPAAPDDASTLPAAQKAAPAASPLDEDTEPAEAPPEFSAVTIRNPFGDGEIEVEEISLVDIPGGPTLAAAASNDAGGDEYSGMASSLREGAWVEFRDDEDMRRPARLSYISPLKGTYLFVNRQGKKVGEYSLYQLAREFRTGNAVVLDEVPLFDRAMTSLVGALKGSGRTH
jgi:hypothetical protein